MPKIEYKGLMFDSELEVNYCKYIERRMMVGEILDFIYHPSQISNLTGKRSYTPDFIVVYKDRIEVVETKGYNPYSKMIDDAIHQVMLTKSEEWLLQYVFENKNRLRYIRLDETKKYRVVYKKIKYLQAFGFVDWDFKNPNTLANKRKAKIQEQNSEIKELRDFKKNAVRYFNYHLKIVKNEKLTKSQKEWYNNYVEYIKKIVLEQ